MSHLGPRRDHPPPRASRRPSLGAEPSTAAGVRPGELTHHGGGRHCSHIPVRVVTEALLPCAFCTVSYYFPRWQ